MAEVLGPTGVRGVDVTTENGTVKYDANKQGFIEINNEKHLKQALAEGLMLRSQASGFNVKDHLCQNEQCSFNAVLPVFTCPKCGMKNDLRD